MNPLTAVVKTEVVSDQAWSIIDHVVSARIFVLEVVNHDAIAVSRSVKQNVVQFVLI